MTEALAPTGAKAGRTFPRVDARGNLCLAYVVHIEATHGLWGGGAPLARFRPADRDA